LTNFKHRQIVQSADGSHTIFLPELGEHFHSMHGALQESIHVFIQQGFLQAPVSGGQVSILEVGFGTGLNGLLTLLVAQAKGIRVRYIGLEAFPLEREESLALNYPEQVCNRQDGPPSGLQPHGYSRARLESLFIGLHNAPWEQSFEPVPGFVLEKRKVMVEEANLPSNQFDLVYFDAFAPGVQPGVWTMQVFEVGEEGFEPPKA
jgi:tRNA U34 5-methylaminomethyl-2-thiouridine-forming methyltransferase MnmC